MRIKRTVYVTVPVEIEADSEVRYRYCLRELTRENGDVPHVSILGGGYSYRSLDTGVFASEVPPVRTAPTGTPERGVGG